MKNFLIYGAASIGSIVKDSLEQYGGKIIGYIDKRAYEIKSYNQLPVWSLDNIPKQYIAEETIVFIGVKNVFEHEKIARALVGKGFQYIVYKPYAVLIGYGSEEEKRISDIYDNLFYAIPNIVTVELPICTADMQKPLHDYALLKEFNKEVIAYIPAEFICTNNYPQGGMLRWGNINILSFFTHIDFFRFLDNRIDASPKEYLTEYCEYTVGLHRKILVTDAWRENVFKNRIQIYEKMNENMNLDPGFFVRNAPEAVWSDESHIFNLTSGKHRCTFLAAKGVKYLPLKIKKADYNKFYHEEELIGVRRLLFAAEERIMIPHPCFYRDDRNEDKGEYDFLTWFARYYGKKNFYKYGKITFINMKIIDWSEDWGYLARFLTRLGCEVHRFIFPTELEKQLNKLFYSCFFYRQDNDFLETNYEIGIIDEARIQDILPYKEKCKNIIIRNCDKDKMEDICNSMNLKIILKITEILDGLERKGTYLLEHGE